MSVARSGSRIPPPPAGPLSAGGRRGPGSAGADPTHPLVPGSSHPGPGGARGVVGRPGRRRRGRVLLGAEILVVLFFGAGVYLAVSFWQVRHAAKLNQTAASQAIVVLGAAQYNGTPSPDLQARLDHALILYHEHLAPIFVVTGGKEPGDIYTEAEASANYLASKGVPQADILREVTGRNTWQSLDSAAAFLKPKGITHVILVSDPFHDERLLLMSGQLGLKPQVSPTRTSPITGSAVVPYEIKEAGEVAVGRVIGFHALDWINVRLHISA
jgi:uncharacterized SAM-binding protein YcdF (DUF218 family)